MKEDDPVAAYFDKLPETHKRQFEQRASGSNVNFQQRLKLACELGGASSGRLLDCAAGTGEITCLTQTVAWGLIFLIEFVAL